MTKVCNADPFRLLVISLVLGIDVDCLYSGDDARRMKGTLFCFCISPGPDP